MGVHPFRISRNTFALDARPLDKGIAASLEGIVVGGHMFTVAKPVWAKGRETEVNLFLDFAFTMPKCDATLRLTASTAYHVYVNGAFVDYGPARAGDGHFRINEYALAGHLTQETNQIRIRVAGYNLSCFEYTRHPSFLAMEVVAGDDVLIATGRDAIACHEYIQRLRYTEKYARQRTFIEVFDLSRAACGEPQQLAIQPEPIYLERRVPYCKNILIQPEMAYEQGTVTPCSTDLPDDYRLFLSNYHPDMHQFETLECHTFVEMNKMAYSDATADFDAAEPLFAGNYRAWKIPHNNTGLISLSFEATEDCVLYFIFDELLVDGQIVNKRANCMNCIKICAPKGNHHVLTFEPYTLQYGKLCVTEGAVAGIQLSMVEIAYPPIEAKSLGDAALDLIMKSAIETFRQNATDIFMDCPSRERAGWLCDSYFTGRSEWTLTGKSTVEYSFLENFVRTTGFQAKPPMPDGMFPMCYPSSHDFLGGATLMEKNYIPNWAMWLVIELEEFVAVRGGDAALRTQFEAPLNKLMAYFAAYENESGLLEDLPGWIFLEWSRANDADVVSGVNYPTSMLYSVALDAFAKLYGDTAQSEKAARIRATIREQSYNGHFFVDNANRDAEGKLVLTQNTTEVCQYYAFFCNVASKETHPALLKILLNDFGPDRKQTLLHPDVAFANAFIGNYLRMEVLRSERRYDQIIREIKGYFYGMAVRTGTLWEYDSEKGSCNHGFASYIACLLLEALGLSETDVIRR